MGNHAFFFVFHWHMKDANQDLSLTPIQMSVFNIFQATKNGGSSSAPKNEQGVKSTWIPGTFWWMRTGENLPENNWVSSWLIYYLAFAGTQSTTWRCSILIDIDRCLLEGAIQFCKPKLAVAFSFTLNIYVWYGCFFPHENESTKAAKRKGSWAHQQTDKISPWTILSLSVVEDVGDSKLWTIGCFKLSNKWCWFLTYPSGKYGSIPWDPAVHIIGEKN